MGKKVILGIDPGTIVMGYGVISAEGQKIKMESLGVIMLSKYEDKLDKLRIIYEKTASLIQQYQPTHCAVEAPFFGKNVQSMLKLGRSQGVAIACALMHQVPVFEYAPRKIKLAVTGNGNASKEQVASMLQQICDFKLTPRFLDATDGLAAAVCHYYASRTTVAASSSAKNWSDFILKNENRLLSSAKKKKNS